MKFGSVHLMEGPFTKSEQQVYDEHIEQIKTSDAIGLDYVRLTEHHFSSVPYVPDVDGEYCICASPFAMACAVAMITENVRIGFGDQDPRHGPSPAHRRRHRHGRLAESRPH